MNKHFLFFGILLNCILCCSFVQKGDKADTYPSKERLFYIERSKNKNIVCYDVNNGFSGSSKTSDPIYIYWIDGEDNPGQKSKLNLVEKKIAYGYKVKSLNENEVIFTINAFAERPVRMIKKENQYICILTIQNQDAVLVKLYVKTNDHNSEKVEYVELYGINEKGIQVVERITNKR